MIVKMKMEIKINGKVKGNHSRSKTLEHTFTHSHKEEDKLVEVSKDKKEDKEIDKNNSFDFNLEDVVVEIDSTVEADCSMKEYLEAAFFSIKSNVMDIIRNEKEDK
jgi:hypothetical protein